MRRLWNEQSVFVLLIHRWWNSCTYSNNISRQIFCWCTYYEVIINSNEILWANGWCSSQYTAEVSVYWFIDGKNSNLIWGALFYWCIGYEMMKNLMAVIMASMLQKSLYFTDFIDGESLLVIVVIWGGKLLLMRRLWTNERSHSHGSVSVVRTTFKVYGKVQTLTLSQPKTPEPIVTKF